MALDLTLKIVADGTQAKAELAKVEQGIQRVEASGAKGGAAVSRAMQAITGEASKSAKATAQLDSQSKMYAATAGKVAQSLGLMNEQQVAAVRGFSAMAGGTGMMTLALTAGAGAAVVLAGAIGATIAGLYAASKEYVTQSGILDYHEDALNRVTSAWDRLKFGIGAAVVGSGADATSWLDFLAVGIELVRVKAEKAIEKLRDMAAFALTGPASLFDMSLPTMQNATTDINGNPTAFGRLQQSKERFNQATSYVPRANAGKDAFQVDREWQQAQEESIRKANAAKREQERIDKAIFAGMRKSAEAEWQYGIAIRQVTNDLMDSIRAQRQQLEVFPPLIANYGYLTRKLTDTRTGAERMDDALRESARVLGVEYRIANEDAADAIQAASAAMEEAEARAREFHDAVLSIAGSLGSMGAFGGLTDDILNVVRAWDQASQAVENYERAQTKMAKAAAVLQGASAVWSATGSKNRAASVGGGALAGAQAGSMFGPWGTAIGAAAGAVMGFVRSRGQGRESVEEFAASRGGFDALHKELQTLGAEGEQLWITLTQGTGHNNPEQARSAIESITRALDAQSDKYARADAAIEKYGFTFEELGTKVQKSRITAVAEQLLQDWEALNFVGVDTDAIINRMSGSVSEFLVKAVQTGTEVPIAMKPMLQQMLEAGTLIGANGEKLEDLEDVTWAKSMTQGFESVTEAIYDLRDALVNGVGGAIDNINSREVVIRQRIERTEDRGEVEVDGENSFANGTKGYQWFGSGKTVRLHGWEKVTPLGKDTATQPMVIKLHIGEHEFADVVVNALDAKHRNTVKIEAR